MPLGFVLPYVGMAAAVGYIHQSLTREQEAAIQRTFDMRAMEDRSGAAFRLTGALGFELPVTAHLTLRLAIHAGVNAARVERGLRALPAGSAQIAIGMR